MSRTDWTSKGKRIKSDDQSLLVARYGIEKLPALLLWAWAYKDVVSPWWGHQCGDDKQDAESQDAAKGF